MSTDPRPSTSAPLSKRPTHLWKLRLKKMFTTSLDHLRHYTGVGVVCAVAYFDPGNWGVDLQAGSEYGYKLLFVVLLAGSFAVFLQVLACRLGCVTGLSLAAHCRLLLYDRPNHPLLYRWLALYPLYVLSEIAIIATDLAELLGSAIALNLLFPRLPLWAGVLLTSVDVLFLLALGDPLRGRPMKMFEILIAVLVLSVLVCMSIIIGTVDIDWKDAFGGYVPSKAIFQGGGLYISVGILGATVMPHSLFLGSHLATQDRTPYKTATAPGSSATLELAATDQSKRLSYPEIAWKALVNTLRAPPIDPNAPIAKRHTDHVNNSSDFIRAHLNHGVADMVISLLGFAVTINSMILILASSVFYYGSATRGSTSPASLYDAHDLILGKVGQVAALLFTLALLASGQSASIVATLAGQSVSEGFLRWRVSPLIRRLVTRTIGLIPSMIVAIAAGKAGVNALLVISQVMLSIVLPFIILPLLWLTSTSHVMSSSEPPQVGDGISSEVRHRRNFSNGPVVVCIGVAIWLLIVAANVYVIVALALGIS